MLCRRLALGSAVGWEPRVLVAGYLLLVGFALRNAGLTGMVLVAFGLLANLAVIVVDGGMPVRGLPAGAADGPRHHGDTPRGPPGRAGRRGPAGAARRDGLARRHRPVPRGRPPPWSALMRRLAAGPAPCGRAR